MGFNYFAKTALKIVLFLLFVHISLAKFCLGARKLTSLYQPPPLAMTYHKGDLLEGNLPVSVVWYGKFSPAQKAIISDFLLSLNPQKASAHPSVSKWWDTVQTYLSKAGKKNAHVVLLNQVMDENCSLGKILKRSHISQLAQQPNSKTGGITLVLTANDVAVEGFCMSNCGYHGSNAKQKSVFIWVGNSVSQCPGQCAWPFHQPIYGPQTAPLGSPNGDVGADGMVINIASLLAGAVTNPYGRGYFLGSDGGHLEAASACSGVYGRGAYPGYAGELLLDPSNGGSYNAHGVNGRKYLLPALFDPSTSQCSMLV